MVTGRSNVASEVRYWCSRRETSEIAARATSTRTRMRSILLESAIDNRPPSNIGRACVTTKEAKRKIITASER